MITEHDRDMCAACRGPERPGALKASSSSASALTAYVRRVCDTPVVLRWVGLDVRHARQRRDRFRGEAACMAERVRARRLTDEEGRRLQQIVRRGKHGYPGPARRDHYGVGERDTGSGDRAAGHLGTGHCPGCDPRVQRAGSGLPGPVVAGGRPRRITDDDIAHIVATAKTRPRKLGRPFTHRSVRKRLLSGW